MKQNLLPYAHQLDLSEPPLFRGGRGTKPRFPAWPLFVLILCLLFSVSSAETRTSIIMLEGMEETIEETRYESPQGFSIWFDNELFTVRNAQSDVKENTLIQSRYTDDSMVLSLCTADEAAKYVSDSGIDPSALSERRQTDLRLEQTNGTFHFQTLIADHGQYLLATGTYSQESAEGNAKYFQRILDSITFAYLNEDLLP